MGIVVIGMALGASFGFCFYMNLYFGDMHPTIPFLLLGIGVDDMYVIVQALNNLSTDEKTLPLHEKIGKAMQHAGVSITVTSVRQSILWEKEYQTFPGALLQWRFLQILPRLCADSVKKKLF